MKIPNGRLPGSPWGSGASKNKGVLKICFDFFCWERPLATMCQFWKWSPKFTSSESKSKIEWICDKEFKKMKIQMSLIDFNSKYGKNFLKLAYSVSP